MDEHILTDKGNWVIIHLHPSTSFPAPPRYGVETEGTDGDGEGKRYRAMARKRKIGMPFHLQVIEMGWLIRTKQEGVGEAPASSPD